MRNAGIPFIDATGAVTAVHQNHDYAYLKFGAAQSQGVEKRRNIELAGGFHRLSTLREADWVLRDGKVSRPPAGRRLLAAITNGIVYRGAIAQKRRVLEHWRVQR